MSIYGCITRCFGCKHAEGHIDYDKNELDATCEIYMRPYAKWMKLGGCEGATHVKRESQSEPTKSRVGQQKQKKAGKK